MPDRKNYQLTAVEWSELDSLSHEANMTAAAALPAAAGGRDLTKLARRKVALFWQRMGEKYGFQWKTVLPENEQERTISAVPWWKDVGAAVSPETIPGTQPQGGAREEA